MRIFKAYGKAFGRITFIMLALQASKKQFRKVSLPFVNCEIFTSPGGCVGVCAYSYFRGVGNIGTNYFLSICHSYPALTHLKLVGCKSLLAARFLSKGNVSSHYLSNSAFLGVAGALFQCIDITEGEKRKFPSLSRGQKGLGELTAAPLERKCA